MKKKTKDTDDKKIKLSLGRIISNNVFALRQMSRGCRGRIAFKLATSAFWGAYAVVQSFFLRYAVNTAQTSGSFTSVMIFLAVWIASGFVVNFAIELINLRLEPYFQYKISKNLKMPVMKKTAECDLACYESPEFYNDYAMTMANCVTRYEQVADSFSNLAWDIVSIFGHGALALLIDPVVLVFALLPFLLIPITKKRMKENFKLDKLNAEQNRRKLYSLRTFYQAAYAKEMRLTNISEPILARFKAATEDAKKVFRTQGRLIGICWFFEMVVQRILSQFSVYVYAAYQTLVTGRMKYGDCVVLTDTVEYLYWDIRDITEMGTQFYEHALYIEKLRGFLDYKPAVAKNEDGPRASYGDLVLEGVSFRYFGSDKDVLKNVSLRIGKGEKIALVGHNGAGKTTLTKLLLRLYDPTEGKITLDGTDAREIELDSYRDTFATVLQDYRHFSMTVKENVLLRPERDGDDELVIDSLKRAGVWDRIAETEQGIDTVLDHELDENGLVLSGGQAQKISIAHIYAKNSPIVILDEPTSALDPVAEYNMYKNMMEACEGRSVVFISHRMSSAVMADRVYLLEDGEVVESGSHDEFMAKGGKYAELFNIQAQNYLGEGGDEE